MKIFPRNDLYGEFVVPTDRSITNRAIMLGAIAKGKTRIVNPFACEDTQTLLSCVKKAGAKVWVKKNCIEIKSPKKLKLSQKFDCGDSVTAMRFLCGAAAGYGGRTVLTGSKSLNKKPMRELKQPLEKAGKHGEQAVYCLSLPDTSTLLLAYLTYCPYAEKGISV